MNRIAANMLWGGCTIALFSTLSIGAWAQTTHQVDVKRGTVTYAAGNDLIVKMEDGSLKHFVVPSDYRLTVDGKNVSVQDLKPGTQLTQTITTTTRRRCGYECSDCRRESDRGKTAESHDRYGRHNQAHQGSRRDKVHD